MDVRPDEVKRIHVRSWRDVSEFEAHGVGVRAIFFPPTLELPDPDGVVEFDGPFAYVLHNFLEVGAINDTHVHEDEEKVHFVVNGHARLHCGGAISEATAGDYFFFPAGIEHSIESLGPDGLEYLVCAIKTVS